LNFALKLKIKYSLLYCLMYMKQENFVTNEIKCILHRNEKRKNVIST
jgi:hypothetical protein